jgi:spermidine/putrescine transport system substrate-binding protein
MNNVARGVVWFGLSILASVSFTGCSPPSAGLAAGKPYAGQTLNVFNWSDYIDPELLAEFERRTGARVQYDTYSSDAELETKLLSGGGGYDVIFPSDRSLPMLIKKDLLAKLDKSLLPNWQGLDPKFLNTPPDPGSQFIAPYFWGTLAVGVRTDKIAAPGTGFETLFDERYQGHITMLDDPEHVVAVALLHLGYPLNSTEDAQLAAAQELLVRQRPWVSAYTSDDYKERLIKGEAWAVLGWSGDILQARKEQPNIRAVVPASGTLIWLDGMAILKNAKQPRLAHEFVNFLLEPEIAARNADFVNYATPVLAAKDKIKKELRNDPAVYPPSELLDRCQWLQDRGAAIEKIENLWQQVRQ